VQEQVNEKAVAVSIKGSKITARILAQAMKKVLNSANNPHIKRGKQSIKSLANQNAGLQNIEIKDDNIKSFERYARKYHVDFALKKDVSSELEADGRSTKWLVFFKGRDNDAVSAAFRDYTSKVFDKSKKPSVISAIRRFQEKIKSQPKKEKSHNHGGHEH
jgi:predicted secreted protein